MFAVEYEMDQSEARVKTDVSRRWKQRALVSDVYMLQGKMTFCSIRRLL